MFFEDFDGPGLDPAVWLPHYLPAWSSRAATRATYALRDSCLVLSIPPEQHRWMPAEHDGPLRVSGVQTGNFSGPLGSTVGQQPLPGGSVVREEQPFLAGWTPHHGRLELRARAVVTPRSMVAWWLVGLEDRPERSAEICVFEVFGDAVEDGSAAVGMGLHPFRDPRVAEDFAAVRLPIDVADWHTYGVDWTADRVTFHVDGAAVRSCPAPPDYPMQTMLAVFDFPARSNGNDADEVPELHVDWVREV